MKRRLSLLVLVILLVSLIPIAHGDRSIPDERLLPRLLIMHFISDDEVAAYK